MQATPTQQLETIDDLSALAWVQEELRRSLETAHKALRRHLKEAEAVAGSDVGNVDPSVLRPARALLHQGVGALELVGLPSAAQVLRAAENALARLAGKPKKLDLKAVEAIEQGSFALLDYLQRMLAGKPLSPLALFPQYRVLQALAGADRIHPADLWAFDWRWRDLPADPSATPPPPGADMRSEVEAQTLALMRDPQGGAAQHLSDLFASLGAGAGGQPQRLATFWQLAAGFFEAQARGLLRPDNYSKRMASRLLAMLRIGEQGVLDASDRLAQDLLFFCAQAASPGDGRGAPRLAAVRLAYGLAHASPVDYESPRLGRFNPAWVVQAKKRVAAAKDSWSAVAGGEMLRLGGLGEQFALVGDSIQRLYGQGAPLAQALQRAVGQTVQAASAPPPELAMEVATSLLYLDASLEDADFEHPAQSQRGERLAARLARVAAGAPPEPLEAWMEDLYRRVSDRQTMGSVVHELRQSLSEVEKTIDQFFREPSRNELLVPVPAQLQSMRGVLSVLGLPEASSAVQHMSVEVDTLAQRPASDGADFEPLAGNLGALGFLIDMLSVQPQMAKTLFSYDAASGRLRSVVGGGTYRASDFSGLDEAVPAAPAPVAPRLIEQAQSLAFAAARPDVSTAEVVRDLQRLSQEALVADQPLLAQTVAQAQATLEQAGNDAATQVAREDLAQQMAEFVATSSGMLTPLFLEEAARAPVPPPPAQAPAAGQTGLEDDAEMREIFLEEAREVLAAARAALDALADGDPDDLSELTTVRRAFHTLKGSGRMVGLSAFGEAAWACEQLYNSRLADGQPADAALLGFSRDALAYLGDWVDGIAAGGTPAHASAPVVQAADAMRLAQRREALPLPGQAVEGADSVPIPSVISLADQVSGLPSADDLDLQPFEATAILPGPARRSDPQPLAANDVVEFDLKLDVWDDEPAAIAPAPRPAGAAPADFDATLGLISLDLPPSALMPLPAATPPEPPPAPMAETATVADVATDAEAEAEAAEARPAPANDADQYRQIGPLTVPITLFNIYLSEADELSRRLGVELAEWSLELHRAVGEPAAALAHSLAGSSSTVGFADLSALARALEQALTRSHAHGRGSAEDAQLFLEVSDDLRRLLHQFAAGFLKEPATSLFERLEAHEARSAQPAAEGRASGFGGLGLADSAWQPLADEPPPVARAAPASALDDEDDVDAIDALDPELWAFFEEEAQELLPQLAGALRDWSARPGDADGPSACMRTLHTLKGGARLAGAMRLGEMAHRLETAIEHLLARDHASGADIEALMGRVDALAGHFDQLRCGGMPASSAGVAPAIAPPVAPAAEPAPEPAAEPAAEATAPPAGPRIALPLPSRGAALDEAPLPAATPVAAPTSASVAAAVEAAPAAESPAIDWSRFVAPTRPLAAAERPSASVSHAAVRVRAPLLDRLVNHAGEVSITRARIESDVGLLNGSLADLAENLERLRAQLRDLELQAETQISSRIEAAKAEGHGFDPLEMDRFTRFQELTRMMAESVNDVATVQRSLQRTLQSAEDQLAAQARLTRDMQDDLLRTRMVEFESLSERLYRVVRQAAKETGKQVRLDLVGGSLEIDRGVLDRMTGAFEHLLRNCVTHGIEAPEQRAARGKDVHGQITVTLAQEGNEVGVEFRDDGAGLDLARIRTRAVAMGLLADDTRPSDGELSQLIFQPGMSTADTVTELAGRGIGMDVVRNEVLAMGGRIETASAAGRGTSFKLVLPLTTAVTQVVMLRAGELRVAVPSTLVELVKRAEPAELARAGAAGSLQHDGKTLPFFWLGALLDASACSQESARMLPLVVVRSAQQRIAVQVDEVMGNQEVVVKNLGAQLSRLPGLAGMTLLPSGSPALIYNPVALAALYGERAGAMTREALAAPVAPQAEAEAQPLAPLVLVVDDSLTVRRVTQRLLEREGYRVTVAKDGIDGLEKLGHERPAVLLSDIEMPRMDGFDLVRNLRNDPRLADLPVVMITSRIAQKHRDVAAGLGVQHYLGKPYPEEELLGLVARYAGAAVEA